MNNIYIIMNGLEELRRKKLEELKKKYMNGGQKMDNYLDTPIQINDADLDEKINKYGLIVVDCWAQWCGP